jgi:RHS repeat-associated protein
MKNTTVPAVIRAGNGVKTGSHGALTGLYDYGYRDYSPTLARFTTVDPIRDGTNWFAYVNNDPVNYIDLWGLSANDGSRALTEAERQLYEQASGHSIDFDKIKLFTNERPTADKVRSSLEGIGISTRSISDVDISVYVNHPDIYAIALPDGSIYMYNYNPSIYDMEHEINHQDTYQKGAVITVGNVTIQLNTAAEVVNQLIIEGQLYDQGIDPYITPGYLEYQARQIEEKTRIILRGTP